MKVTSVCAILFVVIGLNDRVSAQVPDGYEVVVLANDLGIHSRPEINRYDFSRRGADAKSLLDEAA